MKEKLNQIREEALSAIAADNADVEQIRIKYLGKKGELTSVLRGMGALSSEERPIVGQIANEVRAEVEAALAEKVQALKEQALEKQLKDEKIDVTLPSSPLAMGHLHPLTQMQRRIEEIFIGMGFSIAEGPEVEFDYYNFQALNIPENHPARDTQDTFYITENILLRSQTSPVRMQLTQLTLLSSIRLRDLWLIRVSPWVTSRVCLRHLRRPSSARMQDFASVLTTSRSPSPRLRLTFPASYVAVRAVAFVRTRVG